MKRIRSIIFSLLFAIAAYGAETDSIAKRPIIGNFSFEAALNASRILPTNSFLKDYSGNEVIISLFSERLQRQ